VPRARCQQVGTLLTCWRSIAEAATRPLDIGVFAYPRKYAVQRIFGDELNRSRTRW